MPNACLCVLDPCNCQHAHLGGSSHQHALSVGCWHIQACKSVLHQRQPHLGGPHVRQGIVVPLLTVCRPLPHLHRHPPGQVWRPQCLAPLSAAAAL